MRKFLVAAVLAVVVSLCSSLTFALTAAHADEPNGTGQSNPGISGLEVAITSLKPLNPQPKKRLTVTGTVTNRTDTTINTIAIKLRVGQSPVTSVQSVVDLDSNTSIASTRSVPGGEITQQLGNSGGLAPQGTTAFTFSIPFNDIALAGSGIYALNIQAVDFDNDSHSGFTQTFLPWYPRTGTYNPINVVMYWPLSTVPNKTSTSLLMDDQTPTSVDVNGRLNGLISVPGAKESVSWVVDPSLIQTVASMGTGYEYLTNDGQTEHGTRSAAAESWLARAKQTLQGSQVQAMPYANADTSALVANKLRSNAAQSVRSAAPTLSTDLGMPVSETVTWLPEQRMTPEALGVSNRAGSPYAVLSEAALTSNFEFGRSRNPVTTVASDRGPVNALLADTYLSQAFAQQATTPTEQVRLRQRIFALIGAWPQSQNPTSVVVAPPTLWAPNTAVLGQVLATLKLAKWAQPETPAAVLKAHNAQGEHLLKAPSAGALSSSGTTNYFAGVLKAQRSLRPFATVLSNPAEFTNPVQWALHRAESQAWLGNRRNGRALLRTINDQILSGANQVRAVASEVVSVSGDSGSIPITLINDFDQPATVKVRLEATPSVRLEAASDVEHQIPARRKISVEIPIKVIGSEDLPVNIQLLSPTGAIWGTPEEISVRSSAYARAATWVVVAAFALLVGLLTINSIRRRKSAKAAAAAGSAESEVTDADVPTADSADREPGTVHHLDHWRDPRD